MVNIDTIEQEILDLEKRDTTYATIERLAWLYIVRDHFNQEKAETRTGSFSGSEFREACSNVPMDSLLDILSEHMESIKVLFPKEYSAIIKRIEEI